MAHNNFELKVEVVRFNEKDVIATSGAQLIDENFMHKALGSEILQDETRTTSDYFTGANYNINSSSLYTFSIYGEDLDIYNDSSDYIYAWYDNGNWYTEGKIASSYNNNYPTGN